MLRCTTDSRQYLALPCYGQIEIQIHKAIGHCERVGGSLSTAQTHGGAPCRVWSDPSPQSVHLHTSNTDYYISITLTLHLHEH